jgi:glycolate oxidase FAD binding subunit
VAHADLSRTTLELSALVGAERIRRPIGCEMLAAESIVEPQSLDELSEIVRMAEERRIALAPVGACRTLAEIRRHPVEIGISLARLAAIVACEPDDMTLVVQAGIRLREVNRVLAEHRQRLPLDPPSPDSTSIGSLIGAARSGPLRLSEGLACDLLIGVQYVGHGGRLVRGGGRVVKNVAGYDLMKVMTGSFGTLGIITEAAFKVRPLPELYELATSRFTRVGDAFEAARALNDAMPLAHLEVVSPELATQFGGDASSWLLMAGIAGNRAEINYLRDHIARLLGAHAVEINEEAAAEAVYRRLRDVEMPANAFTAQVALPPAELAAFLAGPAADCGFCAHAGSGVARLFSAADLAPGSAIGPLERLRAAARAAHGTLRMLSLAPALRGQVAMFDEPNEGAMRLMRRLKAAFDPAGIFNPRGFVGGL